MSKVAIVTGGSSGIGAAAAQALSKAGCTVYEFSRRDHEAPGVSHISADITDAEQIKNAVEQVIRAEGRIDILVNNAGSGISGAVEFTDPADVEKQFRINLFAMAAMIQAVVPYMREQGGGRIVNVSSVAAVTPIPFQAWYSASKAAVNSLTMSLANELRPFGITVCAVMPGDIKTGFSAARSKGSAGDDVYRGAISRSIARMEKDEQNGMPPEAIGNAICRMALKKHVKLLHTVGIQYQLVILLMRIFPAKFANWIIGLLYAK